jgi:hypothetical protein
MTGEGIRPSDFADFSAVFQKALELVGKGWGVKDAVDKSLRELYPLTHADLSQRVEEAFQALRKERGWGDLRILRELVKMRGLPEKPASDSKTLPHSTLERELAVDLRIIFRAANAKCRAGFDPVDALDMACSELYPHIHRKVFNSAYSRLKDCMEMEGVSARAALRRLSGGGPC